jgi:hypothetical protein
MTNELKNGGMWVMCQQGDESHTPKYETNDHIILPARAVIAESFGKLTKLNSDHLMCEQVRSTLFAEEPRTPPVTEHRTIDADASLSSLHLFRHNFCPQYDGLKQQLKFYSRVEQVVASRVDADRHRPRLALAAAPRLLSTIDVGKAYADTR